MKNRIFLFIIGLGILCAVIGMGLSSLTTDSRTIEAGSKMFNYGIGIGGLVGFVMLLLDGSFIKTRFFNLASGFFIIVLLGALFIIMGWYSFSNYLIIGGIIGIVGSYGLNFREKRDKKRLDYLKLIWVIANNTIAILIIFDLVNSSMAHLPTYIMWLMVIDFAFTRIKEQRMIRKS